MNEKKAELQALNLAKEFVQGKNRLHVLTNITTSFEQGRSYAITGISGSGKSTLLHLLSGIDTPSAGVVLFNGENIAQFSTNSAQHFLNKSIGLVFQQPYLIRELSVLENCMLHGLVAGQPYQEAKIHAQKLLAAVGLAEKADCKPAALSGGQQQRVALARAIFNKPAFLIADEPTGSLDPQTGTDIVNLLLRCQQEWGMGIIVSSHDKAVADRMEMVYHLHNGSLHCINNASK